MKVEVFNNALDVKYNFYKYNKDKDTIDEISTPVFNDYDTVISENNKNTSLIIRCIFNIVSNVDIEIKCSIDDFSSYCVSNISNYQFIQNEEISNLDISSYNTLTSTNANNYTFISDGVKSTSIQTSLNNVHQLFIVINYDDSLIVDLNNGEPYLSDDLSTTISFYSDLTSMTFTKKD